MASLEVNQSPIARKTRQPAPGDTIICAPVVKNSSARDLLLDYLGGNKQIFEQVVAHYQIKAGMMYRATLWKDESKTRFALTKLEGAELAEHLAHPDRAEARIHLLISVSMLTTNLQEENANNDGGEENSV